MLRIPRPRFRTAGALFACVLVGVYLILVCVLSLYSVIFMGSGEQELARESGRLDGCVRVNIPMTQTVLNQVFYMMCTVTLRWWK